MMRKVSFRAPAVSLLAAGACLSCSSPSPSSAPTPEAFSSMALPDPATAPAMQGESGAALPAASASNAATEGGAATPAAPNAEAPMPMQLAPTTPPAMPPAAAAPQPANPAPPAAPSRLCASKLRIQTPLIADFESYDGTLEASQFTFAFGLATPNTGV